MKRFMSFTNIMDLVSAGLVQPGLIIKSTAYNQTLILNQFTLANSSQTMRAFCDEDRNIIQTIDPGSVWELVNVDFEGDVHE